MLTALWINRDLRLVDDPGRLWWAWAGSGPDRFLTATTLHDLVLLCVYVVVALSAPRSRVAAAALAVTGLVTLAVRAPTLWIDGFAEVYPHGLRMWAMVSTFVALGLAAALLIVVAAGRRPVRAYGSGPTRPGRGAGLTAFLLLGAAGVITAAWEVYAFTRTPGAFAHYSERFTGSGGALQLLGMPAGWAALVVAAAALTGAVGALVGAVHSRPLGLVAAALVGTGGAAGVSAAVRTDLFAHLGGLALVEQLTVAWWVLGLLTGGVVLLVLARRGVPVGGEPRLASNVYDGYGQGPVGGPGGGFGPPPPSSRPPGW
ncbi:hypothetical protein [Streptomyces sp. NPDC058657]|uniref:hypothetical protein n=1 Tax=unclassified Streptomyces TaxID=2593676 RepID=UPI0036548C58